MALRRALERECGYIVLGALCTSWGARTLSLSACEPQPLPAGPGAANPSSPQAAAAAPGAADPSSPQADEVTPGAPNPSSPQAEEAAAVPSPPQPPVSSPLPAGGGAGGVLAQVVDCLALALGDGARAQLDEGM